MLKYFVLLLLTLKNSDDVKLKVIIRQQAGMIKNLLCRSLTAILLRLSKRCVRAFFLH